MPNLVLMAPRDENELRHMLKASLGYDRPVAIRFPKALGRGVAMDPDYKPIAMGRAEVLRQGSPGGGLILAYGAMVHPALEAAAALEAEGLRPTVVDARFAKPLDEELILRLAEPAGKVITVEEAVTAGGFGSAVRELLDARERYDVKVLEIGLPIEVYPVGKVDQIRRDFGLDVPGLTARFRAFLIGGHHT